MSKQELPEPWGSKLGPKGIHSLRDLAGKADVSAETARRLITGGRTSAETVNKVAAALFDGDRTLVWSLHGTEVRDYGDWTLPAESSLLDDDQRAAIVAVVRGMVPVAVKRKELRNSADRSPANKDAGGPGEQDNVTEIKPRKAPARSRAARKPPRPPGNED